MDISLTACWLCTSPLVPAQEIEMFASENSWVAARCCYCCCCRKLLLLLHILSSCSSCSMRASPHKTRRRINRARRHIHDIRQSRPLRPPHNTTQPPPYPPLAFSPRARSTNTHFGPQSASAAAGHLGGNYARAPNARERSMSRRSTTTTTRTTTTRWMWKYCRRVMCPTTTSMKNNTNLSHTQQQKNSTQLTHKCERGRAFGIDIVHIHQEPHGNIWSTRRNAVTIGGKVGEWCRVRNVRICNRNIYALPLIYILICQYPPYLYSVGLRIISLYQSRSKCVFHKPPN